jgi:carbon-monoxide dehydrogenase large subunit
LNEKAFGFNGLGFDQIGARLPRREDERLLTGQGRYVDDIVVPGALHACFVRSPHAHARIVSIDCTAALACPGVVAVYTGVDLRQWTTRHRMAPPIDGLAPMEMDTLPVDKVRFQGDPVACVIATDRYLAEDAAEQVMVQWEVLPAIANLEQAMRADAQRVDESLPSNLLSKQAARHGEVDAAMREAYRVVEARFAQHRQTHLPVETRGCIATWDAGRRHLEFVVGNQVPHPYRTALAARLRLSESQVTVISPDVGGGFGQKIALYREELTVAACAIRLSRPVRWREDRMENLLASSQAREDVCRTRVAVDPQGRVLALELTIDEDFGAYSFYPGNYLARVVAMIITGPYRIRQYAYEVRVWLSNKVGNGPMRAPMAITSWVMDGTLDAVAHELGLDPAEVRRVNLLRPDELPFTMPTGEVLADVSTTDCFESALVALDYPALRARQASARAQERLIGIGLCNVVESTTYGSRFYKAAGIAGSGHEAAWVRIEPSGAVNASVGLGATGQGYETSLAQAVAEGLGVDATQVSLKIGHTDIAPYGMGSRGARGGTAGGSCLYLCARKAQAAVLKIAAYRLGLADTEKLRMLGGQIERLRDSEADARWEPTGLTLADIARTAYLDPLALPPDMSPGLDFSTTYEPPPMTYSNSTHACVVEVDRGTGAVKIERYLVAEDCGTVLNPLVVEGQQHGAIAMGLSGSLFEEIRYDALTGQNLSGSLAQYLVATACELPRIELIARHTPSLATPVGIKGMAEGGVMGAIGAIGNAIQDALGHLGVRADSQPFTPMALHGLIHAAERPDAPAPTAEGGSPS